MKIRRSSWSLLPSPLMFHEIHHLCHPVSQFNRHFFTEDNGQSSESHIFGARTTQEILINWYNDEHDSQYFFLYRIGHLYLKCFEYHIKTVIYLLFVIWISNILIVAKTINHTNYTKEKLAAFNVNVYIFLFYNALPPWQLPWGEI